MPCLRHDTPPTGRLPFALPGAPRRFARDREVDLRHVVLELDVDFGSRSLRGRVTHHLVPLRPGVRTLRLDAVELDVSAVRLAGRRVAFRNDGAALTVDAGKPLAEGREVTLVVDYSCTPRRGFYFLGPDASSPKRPLHAWSQGQDEDSRHWWPVHDYPNEKATTEMIATVPAGMVAVSNGRLVGKSKKGRRTTWHWKLGTPHVPYLVTLAVGPFECLEQSLGSLPLTTWFLPGRRDEALRCVKDTPRMVKLFGDLLGVPYPYEKYDQVFVEGFIFGGMENTSATTLTDTVLHDEKAALDYTCEDLIAHELAHQWWGNLVTCRDWSQAWLNEGFATWSELLWKEHARGEDEEWMLRRELADDYFKEDREGYRRPVVCRTYHDPIELFDAHLYQKGAWVVSLLRDELGDELFWRALNGYLAAHRGGSVETDDLRRAVERASGRNFEKFFDQWIGSGGYPELKVSSAWDGKRSELAVHVEQGQSGEQTPEVYELAAEVAFHAGGRWRRETVRVDRRSQTFLFALSSEPDAVVLDPRERLLKSLSFDRPVGQLVFCLEKAPWAPARAEAAAALGRNGSAPAVRALVKALERRKEFWGVLAAVAEALGETRHDAARDALVRALAHPHPKARRAAAGALGAFRGSNEAFAALAPILAKGDASWFVEAEAATALGRLRHPDSVRTLAREAGSRKTSWNETVRVGALDGLGQASFEQRAEAIAALMPFTEPRWFVRLRQAAVRNLARLGRGHDGVRERLEQLCEDPEFRVQLVVADALGELGDRRSKAALGRLAESALDGRLRRSAAQSLRRIARAEEGGGALAALRADVDELQAETRRLRGRLDKLELRGEKK